MVLPEYYENLHVLHVNTMPNRSYYIPASERGDHLAVCREDSDRLQMLSGEWDFHYYESTYEVPEKFYETGSVREGYQKVKVPGVWQAYGFDQNQYTNVRYPFPANPPYVPKKNPSGAYVRKFHYKKEGVAPKAYLNFEGVDSCFYVWLNGNFVGYSQVSHSTSEFDVTEYVLEGENLLAVLVLKWCDGSYMEDQDKFRMSGIFRDVYLLKRPENTVFDYFVHTEHDREQATVSIQMNFTGNRTAVSAALYDLDGKEVACADAEAVRENVKDNRSEYPLELTMLLKNPVLWNAENPYRYTLVLKGENETITDSVGIRTIESKNGIVYLNGQAIKFRGVNRHDSDPVTGFAICPEQMKKDLRLMKEHNINAIRTSHYPNAPVFYHLCEIYGFYVIDEADNESHGMGTLYHSEESREKDTSHWNYPIADNAEFIEATVDRSQRLVYRDKNRSCVLIWSMGNECAFGCTFEKALEWTKQFDPDRLTHYESAKYVPKGRKNDYANIDLHSEMYPGLNHIENYFAQSPDKPYIMCEYSHAMGNGPGDLEDYFELIQKYPGFCGGFIWEWCDHGIYMGTTPKGKEKYFYGGDSGERLHDGNFCMDGLVYPNRRVHTGLKEAWNVNRPLRARCHAKTGERIELILHNYLDFTDSRDFLSISWELNCDGRVLQNGILQGGTMPSIPPHEEADVALPIQLPECGRCFLKLIYRKVNTAGFLEKDHILGFDEMELSTADSRNQTAVRLIMDARKKGNAVSFRETETHIYVENSHFSYTFSKLTGVFDEMVYQNQRLFDAPMELNIWRAPTDNDRNIKHTWMQAGYDRTYSYPYEISYEKDGEDGTVTCHMGMVADALQPVLKLSAVYRIHSSGAVTVQMDAEKNMEFPELPRFGIRMFLPKSMHRLTYYGMGPQESYIDKHRASSHGIYYSEVSAMQEDYIHPQENGSHTDCSYVIVGGESVGLAATGEKTFSMNASVYTQEELTEKAHNYELTPCGSTVLCLDYKMNGIGSNSCGPKLLQKYSFNEEHFTFEITLIPELSQKR